MMDVGVHLSVYNTFTRLLSNVNCNTYQHRVLKVYVRLDICCMVTTYVGYAKLLLLLLLVYVPSFLLVNC